MTLRSALPLALLFCFACSTDGEPPTATPAASDRLLEPPPPGQGLRMETDKFAVEPGDEVQDCYFFKVSDLAKQSGLPGDQPTFIHRMQIAQRAGSHHMNIFRVKTVVGLGPQGGAVQHGKNGAGECFKSANWADWPLVANTQQDGTLDWTLPDGVASRFEPDEWLMLQTHFVNATTQKTPDNQGRVEVNFWSTPADQVKAEMGTLFATKQSIRVCRSNPRPQFEGTCQFNSPDPVTIIGANGHFHSRGRHFEMFSWDGQTPETPPLASRFYESTAWSDPPMLTSPSLSAAIQPGGGVWYTCDFQWEQPPDAVGCDGLDKIDAEKYSTSVDNLDCCYTFGPVVDRSEHCNIFVYYYPKRDDVNCF